MLTTTVTAGGGSTSLTLAAAATNSVTGGFATFDDAPLLATGTSSAHTNGGPLFIPCNSSLTGARFIVGSYLQLAGGGAVNVEQCGSLWLDAPLEWDADLNWFGTHTGSNNGAAAVALNASAEIDVDTAYPGIYSSNPTSIYADHTFLNQYPGNNDALLAYMNGSGGPGLIWTNSTWQTGETNGNNDYMGVHLIVGPTNMTPDNTFTNDSFVSGPAEAANLSATPLVIFQGNGQNHFDNCTFNRRTIATVGTSMAIQVRKGCWVQGPITPFLMSNASSESIGGTVLEGINQDTSGQPVFGNWAPGVYDGVVEISSPAESAPNVVTTGSGVGYLVLKDLVALPGQTQNYQSTGNSGGTGGSFFTTNAVTPNLNNVIYVDGVTYPLTAAGIQAALNAGGKNSHVILPPGTITVSVESGCMNVYDGQWISGAGKYVTTVKRANGGSSNNHIFCIDPGGGYGSTGNNKFTDFTIDGNYSNETGGGEAINGGAAAKVTIQNMRFINQWSDAIGLWPAASSFASDIDIEDNDFENNGLRAGCTGIFVCRDVVIQYPQNVKILHNHSTGSQNFVGFSNQTGAGNVEVGDNTITGGLGFVVALGGSGTTASGANIHDNIVSMAGTANENVFDLASWNDIVVRGNVVLAMGTCCSDVADNPPAQRVTITSNRFIGSASAGTNNCITLGGSDLAIEGNYCSGSGGGGIEITLTSTSHSKNIIISGNEVKNNGQAATHAGIETFLTTGGSASLGSVVIQGNRVYDDQGSPTQAYGIGLAVSGQTTGYSNFTIEGNDLRGNKIAAISNSTSGATGMLISDNQGDTTNASGAIASAALSASGTAATLTGTGACATITTQSGGSWAGKATCTGTTGASTFVITPGITAPNGWNCRASYDYTTQTNTFTVTSNTTSCTLTGTVNANDVIYFEAVAF